MSRPLINLSIIELTQLFEDSVGNLNVAIDLLKELRHRSTPKANALNKRVMGVIAQNSSYAALQSLHVPELEALAMDCSNKPQLRENLIKVLQTRGSVKGRKLLEKLTNMVVSAGTTECEGGATTSYESESSAAKQSEPSGAAFAVTQNADHSPNTLQATLISERFITSKSSKPTNVEWAFSLLGVPATATWNRIEEARQRCVSQYRPGSGFDIDSATKALKLINEAHSVLAEYMKNKN